MIRSLPGMAGSRAVVLGIGSVVLLGACQPARRAQPGAAVPGPTVVAAGPATAAPTATAQATAPGMATPGGVGGGQAAGDASGWSPGGLGREPPVAPRGRWISLLYLGNRQGEIEPCG